MSLAWRLDQTAKNITMQMNYSGKGWIAVGECVRARHAFID